MTTETTASELRHYLQVMRRKGWIIVVSTAVAALVGVMIGQRLPVTYRATATILVSGDAASGQDFAAEQVTRTYTELLLRRPVVEATARSLGLEADEVRRRVYVHQVSSTPLIEVNAEASDPALARDLANGIVTSFLALVSKSPTILQRELPVIEEAILPQQPESGISRRIVFAVAVLGFVLSSGFLFVSEALADRVGDVTNVQQLLGLPVLMALPARRRPLRWLRKSVAPTSEPEVSEAYRVLRAVLQPAYGDGRPRALLLAGIASGAEAATTVVNLGLALAENQQKVLLVDADLRRPKPYPALAGDGPGLSAYVVAPANVVWQRFTFPLAENLCVLPRGVHLEDPLRLFGAPLMGRLVGQLRHEVDLVLFNSSPLAQAADAIVLAPHMDGVILVLDSERVRPAAATQAVAMLRSVQANLLGVIVLNARGVSQHYYADFSKVIPPFPVVEPPSTNGYHTDEQLAPTTGGIVVQPVMDK